MLKHAALALLMLLICGACFTRPASKKEVTEVSRPPSTEAPEGVEIISAPPEDPDDKVSGERVDDETQDEEAAASTGSYLATLVAEPGYALVYSDTWFYTDASLDAPRVRLDTERDLGSWSYTLVEVVREVDGMLEIATPQRYGEGCSARQLYALRNYGVRLYVQPDAIAPVVRETYAQTFDNGTRVVLYSGLPVEMLDDGRAKIEVGWQATHLALELPEGTVGTRFEIVSPDLPIWEPTAKLALGAEVTLATSTWTLDDTQTLYIHATEDRKKDTLVTTYDACLEATFAVDGQAIEALGTSSNLLGALGGGVGYSGANASLAAGTELTWPDGRRAGEVVATHPMQDWVTQNETQSCFYVYLDASYDRPPAEEERRLTLCVDPADITR